MTFADRFYGRLLCLPGRTAGEFPPDVFPRGYRTAAVLLAFWPETDGGVSVVLTQRSDTLPSHQGQVSFPGGGTQPGDGSIADTALREAREELGIDPRQVRIMGRLDDAWSRFGFHVVPIVGWLERRPEFTPAPDEVAGLIVADVETLMRPAASTLHRIADRETRAYRWDGGYVWGLTAEILFELFLWVRGEASSRRDVRLENMRRQLRGNG